MATTGRGGERSERRGREEGSNRGDRRRRVGVGRRRRGDGENEGKKVMHGWPGFRSKREGRKMKGGIEGERKEKKIGDFIN